MAGLAGPVWARAARCATRSPAQLAQSRLHGAVTLSQQGSARAAHRFAALPRSAEVACVGGSGGVRVQHACRVPVVSSVLARGRSTQAAGDAASESPYFAWHPSDHGGLKGELPSPPSPATDDEAAEMAAFCARVQLDFENDNTLLLAVTDPSVGGAVNNARLAAVGRAVVTAALTEYLYVRFPRLPASQMLAVVAEMTKRETLLRAGNNIGIMHLLRTNVPDIRKVLYKPETHASIAEGFLAVVGAVFVDRGTATAHDFALNMLVPPLEYVGVSNLAKIGDPKGTLATLLSDEGFKPAVYKVMRSAGGKNAAGMVLVEVYSGDRLLGEGAGFTQAAAEASAARAVLLARYTEEVSEVVLPSSWGNFAVADAEALISDLFPATKSDDK